MEWLGHFKPDLAPLFGGLTSASMEVELPLQAADVLCWHLQRYYRGRFSRTDENRMWWLLKERDGDLYVWERPALQEVADAIALLKAKGTAGRAKPGRGSRGKVRSSREADNL